MTNELKINQIPSKTWYWLHLNDTALTWDADTVPCSITVKDQQGNEIEKTDGTFEPIATGAGENADALFLKDKTAETFLSADDGETKTVHIEADGSGKSSASGICRLEASEGAELTVYEVFTKNDAEAGYLAFRTLILAKAKSHVRLVQIFMQGEAQSLLNDVGCVCAEDAAFDVLQIFVGKGDLYHGIRTDLLGVHAETKVDIGYLGQKTQTIDMNLIVNHYGKKTHCEIQVDGTLKDAANKTFRGTIDFKNGASESTGAETEHVLLLGDDVVNKTIPVILCAEEDVEGAHGATIGELDEETLFYFESRGIDADTAEAIMTQGMFEMLLRRIGDEQIEQTVERQLTEVMADERD